ncbi:cytochrome-c peroxidase [Roseimaritima sediminicola]|uniref:cytochrome-c peroxidase n=1 Tax=Roseimaritima sediminicola TaxID=2662066 RepID=UPI00129835AE|nr:cytochrome c peroxidase [Roseimaritima sediminicola]
MNRARYFTPNQACRRWRLALLPVLAGCLLATTLSAADSDSDTVTLGDAELLAGIPGEGPLTMKEIEQWLAMPEIHEPLKYELPRGLNAAAQNAFVPDNNPITRAKIELGRQLYFDPRLSADASVSCATCHDPSEGYAAHTQFGVGIRDQQGGRNSPVAYNRILSREQFWDGRAATLEDQAIGPIENPIEMGNNHDACVECLEGIPGYKKQFETIFEDGVTILNVGKALATFERAIVTGPAPYDYYLPLQRFREIYADDLPYLDEIREEDPEFVKEYEDLVEAFKQNSMSESAINGMKLFFGKANCATCHAGANFTDEQYHNLGVGMDAQQPDLGRYEITKAEADKGAFKTPTLRNVASSPPYMHDGSQQTLEEVMHWYNKGGHPNPWLSDKMKKLNLTDSELADVVAFMKEGLTGSFPEVQTGRLPE